MSEVFHLSSAVLFQKEISENTEPSVVKGKFDIGKKSLEQNTKKDLYGLDEGVLNNFHKEHFAKNIVEKRHQELTSEQIKNLLQGGNEVKDETGTLDRNITYLAELEVMLLYISKSNDVRLKKLYDEHLKLLKEQKGKSRDGTPAYMLERLAAGAVFFRQFGDHLPMDFPYEVFQKRVDTYRKKFKKDIGVSVVEGYEKKETKALVEEGFNKDMEILFVSLAVKKKKDGTLLFPNEEAKAIVKKKLTEKGKNKEGQLDIKAVRTLLRDEYGLELADAEAATIIEKQEQRQEKIQAIRTKYFQVKEEVKKEELIKKEEQDRMKQEANDPKKILKTALGSMGNWVDSIPEGSSMALLLQTHPEQTVQSTTSLLTYLETKDMPNWEEVASLVGIMEQYPVLKELFGIHRTLMDALAHPTHYKIKALTEKQKEDVRLLLKHGKNLLELLQHPKEGHQIENVLSHLLEEYDVVYQQLDLNRTVLLNIRPTLFERVVLPQLLKTSTERLYASQEFYRQQLLYDGDLTARDRRTKVCLGMGGYTMDYNPQTYHVQFHISLKTFPMYAHMDVPKGYKETLALLDGKTFSPEYLYEYLIKSARDVFGPGGEMTYVTAFEGPLRYVKERPQRLRAWQEMNREDRMKIEKNVTTFFAGSGAEVLRSLRAEGIAEEQIVEEYVLRVRPGVTIIHGSSVALSS